MSRTSATEPPGLTTDEAEALLRQWGPNEFAAAGRTSALSHLRASFVHPLALVLLAAAAVSAAVGEAASAGLIAVVVLIGGGINFVQTYRSQVAMERLRAGVAPTATVRRDGRWGSCLAGRVSGLRRRRDGRLPLAGGGREAFRITPGLAVIPRHCR